jgi:AraC family transcriptional regulator
VFEARARHVAPADLEELALELARSVIAPHAVKRGTLVTERRRIVRAAIAQLHDHLAENLPVSTLAGRIGCSPFHLMRVFQRETGATLRRYRIRLRVAAAIERLAAGHDDLATLACELGFASHAHLCDVFRREVGGSPSQLRRTLRHT